METVRLIPETYVTLYLNRWKSHSRRITAFC